MSSFCLPSVHPQAAASGPSALRHLIRLSLHHGQCLCFPCVYVCVCVCRVRVTQAVLLLWYHLCFTEPPLCGTTAGFYASRHLFLSEISRDLQKEEALIWWGAQPQPVQKLRYREVYFTLQYRYFSQNKLQSNQYMLFERWRIWSNTICVFVMIQRLLLSPVWSIIVRNI